MVGLTAVVAALILCHVACPELVAASSLPGIRASPRVATLPTSHSQCRESLAGRRHEHGQKVEIVSGAELSRCGSGGRGCERASSAWERVWSTTVWREAAYQGATLAAVPKDRKDTRCADPAWRQSIARQLGRRM